MNENPLHLTEEDLILHYYGEHSDKAPVERHLSACSTCSDEFAKLSHVLTLVDRQDVPAPAPAFEREVWTRLQPQLALHRQTWWSRVLNWTPLRSGHAGASRWVLAGGVTALVLVAFIAGRFTTVPPAPDVATASPDDVARRILVVAVVDHLDRSQMVLVELMNADLETSTDIEHEQLRARELVSANRLYRQTAVRTGDDATGDVLDELERVLLEIANTPPDVTKDELEALRAQIAQRGLLFKVRVVHSEMRERERQSLVPGSTS